MAKRSPEQLKTLLHQQYRFLLNSARGYDEGDRFEAKRIAMVLRTLFRSANGSRSLTDQLGLADESFYSSIDMTAAIEELAGLWFFDETTSTYEAITTMPRFSTGFEIWWTSPVYRIDGENLSRERFVLHSANRDGGAHVDPDDVALSDSIGSGTFYRAALNSAGGRIEITADPLELAMRTMAGEVHATLSHLGYS